MSRPVPSSSLRMSVSLVPSRPAPHGRGTFPSQGSGPIPAEDEGFCPPPRPHTVSPATAAGRKREPTASPRFPKAALSNDSTHEASGPDVLLSDAPSACCRRRSGRRPLREGPPPSTRARVNGGGRGGGDGGLFNGLGPATAGVAEPAAAPPRPIRSSRPAPRPPPPRISVAGHNRDLDHGTSSPSSLARSQNPEEGPCPGLPLTGRALGSPPPRKSHHLPPAWPPSGPDRLRARARMVVEVVVAMVVVNGGDCGYLSTTIPGGEWWLMVVRKWWRSGGLEWRGERQPQPSGNPGWLKADRLRSIECSPGRVRAE